MILMDLHDFRPSCLINCQEDTTIGALPKDRQDTGVLKKENKGLEPEARGIFLALAVDIPVGLGEGGLEALLHKRVEGLAVAVRVGLLVQAQTVDVLLTYREVVLYGFSLS